MGASDGHDNSPSSPQGPPPGGRAIWFLRYANQQYGPYDVATARQYATQNPNGLAWREGFPAWLPIGQVLELNVQLVVRPSPVPPVLLAPPPALAPLSAPPVVPLQSQPPLQTPRGYGQPGLGTEVAVALAANQSFVGKACLVWLLYWFFWIPGFILNLVFLSEAKRVGRIVGTPPPGKGCLVALLWFYILVPIILGVIGVIFILKGGLDYLSHFL